MFFNVVDAYTYKNYTDAITWPLIRLNNAFPVRSHLPRQRKLTGAVRDETDETVANKKLLQHHLHTTTGTYDLSGANKM